MTGKNSEIKYVYLNEDGMYLVISNVGTHGGEVSTYHWTNILNEASVLPHYLGLGTLKWSDKRAPRWITRVAAVEQRTVKLATEELF